MKKKKGSSMVYVLLITASVMLVGTTCLTSLAMGLKATIEENKRTQSLYGADAGVEWAKSLLAKTFQAATEYAEAVVKENCDPDSTEAQLNEAFKTAFIEFISTKDDNDEFKKALISGSYITSLDKNSKKTIPFSHETETTPTFKNINSQLNNKKTEYRIDLTSIYGETTNGIRNDREISVTFNIRIPDFQGQYAENVDIYPIYNDKVIAIDGNLDVNQSNVTVTKGDIFVGGNPVKDLANSNASYDKYVGGIRLDQSTFTMSNETSNNIITANTLNLVSGSNLEGTNLYARNLYLGSTDPGSYNNGDSSIEKNKVTLDEVVLDNDLAIKSADSEVIINKFYGINDKTYETTQINTETGDVTEVSQTSSSIIVNQQSSTLRITEECYIMGVAYIDTVGKKYETGESIAVKGNYVAYTQPLETFNNFEFSYYEPLYLVDKVNGTPLTVVQKNDYFYEFAYDEFEKQQANQLASQNSKVEMKESSTVLSSGGVELPDLNNPDHKIFTVGAIVYRSGENLVIEKGKSYGNTEEKVIEGKQSDFANMVYNLGPTSGNSLKTYASNDGLKVSDVIDFELLKSRCVVNGNQCQTDDLFIDVSTDNSSTSTINLKEKFDSAFTGIIITNKNIRIDDDFQLDGILITTGNVEINTEANNNGKTDQKVNVVLNYDENVVRSIISRNFELLDGVFKGEKLEPEEVNGFLEYDPNNYNPMDFISTDNWDLIR